MLLAAGEVVTSDADDIACWFTDTDDDLKSPHACRRGIGQVSDNR